MITKEMFTKQFIQESNNSTDLGRFYEYLLKIEERVPNFYEYMQKHNIPLKRLDFYFNQMLELPGQLPTTYRSGSL
jgi:hypothetical protein